MNKQFLEKYPLYRKFTADVKWRSYQDGPEARQLPKPAINMSCSECNNSIQTFNMDNDYHRNYANESIIGEVRELIYKCSSCENSLYHYLVYFYSESLEEDSDYDVLVMQKVRQIPAWSIEMDAEVGKMLGDHSEYYKNGLVCESQGYGIGAYAYFRRVVEDIIDELLESILDLVKEEDKDEYKEKLEEVKQEKIAENKINLVKDLLPESLQVDGVNPLKTLYGVLSDGVHNKTDEECMEEAEAIREILVFLVNQVIRTKKDKQSFTESMKKILGNK